MATSDELKKKKIESIQAKGFYEELAQFGMLEDFIKNNFRQKYENDQEFRDKILDIMRRNSQFIEPELEKEYLDKLIDSIEYFLENTRGWRNPKQ
jgi:hypothetical protein